MFGAYSCHFKFYSAVRAIRKVSSAEAHTVLRGEAEMGWRVRYLVEWSVLGQQRGGRQQAQLVQESKETESK